MKTTPLLLGLLAVAGAGTSAALYVKVTRARAAHERQLAQATSQARAAEARVTELTAQAAALDAQVLELDTALGETKTKLTATEARTIQLTRELADAKQSLLAVAPQAEALQRELTEAKQALATAVATLAANPPAPAPAPSSASIAPSVQPDAILVTNHSRDAFVASVGPASAFVVLSYGSAHGARPEQQLLIRRGTDVLARVLISDVRDQYSIAQVRPDSLRAALHKGDLAVLTD